ncbi:nucleotidyltransferase family protein [Paracoccus aminovorans]|uniref:nucleotidyltransferase family protein n=1 Tax=Paracoccus aminovorans TaxID=34004 RepID=UPI002B25D52F|nr:NTP transferase domain-containing protein [Paracoccus aminovorans]
MGGMRHASNMACVLLAAGHSRRWGPDNKLLATWRGQPLAWHAARLLRGVPCRWRGVVCRDAGVASFFPDAIHLRPCGEEQSDSLHRAVSFAANHKADFLLILLADMPDLTLEDVARVGDAVTEDRPAAAIHSEGRFGPPACFPKAMFTRMLRITADKGAGQLLQDAKGVPIPAAHLVDVDRPADIAAEGCS